MTDLRSASGVFWNTGEHLALHSDSSCRAASGCAPSFAGITWARRFAAGLPCRARCAVSPLRAGIPRASARSRSLRADACPAARSTHRRMHDRRRLCRHHCRPNRQDPRQWTPHYAVHQCPQSARRSADASGGALGTTACGSDGTANPVSVAVGLRVPALSCYLVLPILTLGSRAAVRDMFPQVRGGRCRSSAARAKCPACNGLQCAVAWLVRKRVDDALRRFVLTPHASMMLVVPCAAMARAFLPNRRLWTTLYCWTECILWRTAAKLLESLRYFRRGSLENRRSRPAVLWRTVRFPEMSARPRRTSASQPGCNAPVFGPQPVAFSSRTWPGEPATQRIPRSRLLGMTAEDFAIVASAMTLEAESRRSETDPPAFRIVDEPVADPRRSRSHRGWRGVNQSGCADSQAS